jgi:putative aldouronate transport system permease protein
MNGIIYATLIAIGFIMIYPFWNAMVISLNVGADTAKGGLTFWPRQWTLENYKVVFERPEIMSAFKISVFRTVMATVLGTTVNAMLAYGLSKKELMGRKFFTAVCIFTMYFGGGLIPFFLVIRNIGLLNSFWAMVIPFLVNVWYMVIFRTFFTQIPKGLEESALIDGCNYLQIFTKIVLPVSKPVIATITLFTAVHHWNEWFNASVFITNSKLLPIQAVLRQIINSNVMQELDNANGAAMDAMRRATTFTTQSLVMSAMMVATIPIILVYPFVQKYFVQGVMIGSLKE